MPQTGAKAMQLIFGNRGPNGHPLRLDHRHQDLVHLHHSAGTQPVGQRLCVAEFASRTLAVIDHAFQRRADGQLFAVALQFFQPFGGPGGRTRSFSTLIC